MPETLRSSSKAAVMKNAEWVCSVLNAEKFDNRQRELIESEMDNDDEVFQTFLSKSPTERNSALRHVRQVLQEMLLPVLEGNYESAIRPLEDWQYETLIPSMLYDENNKYVPTYHTPTKDYSLSELAEWLACREISRIGNNLRLEYFSKCGYCGKYFIPKKVLYPASSRFDKPACRVAMFKEENPEKYPEYWNRANQKRRSKTKDRD